MRTPPILFGALLLSACGPLVDDPSNPPLRGRWQREMRVTSLVQDDIWIDRKDAPFKLPDDETKVLGCIEPKLRTAAEVNSLIENGDQYCTLDTLEASGATIAGSGKCAPVERSGITLSGTMEVAGRQAADRVSADVSLSLVGRTPMGLSRRFRAGVEAKWTRLGDCGL